ncbi:uncharacterized protein A1O5_10568 [Cladophialophora psammophila CBS 110553]|uniref:Calcineurin-like phosphoesterase domain-containing protein n=1 Tax=Cladophialophora psammophila CBS 110553 TaxID=1182543 RepID=W9WP47_9EURO|nr:uncharacterized protein A1O5_10568 [Cladophialophora psammophila CBS 110553]EXJ66416.1 hypothetical protein A1O5_10568 [Cladophialophora psammophila CBS 110553]
MDTATVKTRLPILSDTHGTDFNPAEKPLPRADIDAPLKLAISANHDFTLGDVAFRNKVAEATPPLDLKLVEKEYGAIEGARRLWEDAKDIGIILLDEGTHHFTLQNGAHLTVYASPYTPSLGACGFQYHPDRGHNFAIQEGVDVVITHGPPKGIMDYTHGRERAGCADLFAALFAAVAQARPRVHCFGHIHEGWGAWLVTWRVYARRPTDSFHRDRK